MSSRGLPSSVWFGWRQILRPNAQGKVRSLMVGTKLRFTRNALFLATCLVWTFSSSRAVSADTMCHEPIGGYSTQSPEIAQYHCETFVEYWCEDFCQSDQQPDNACTGMDWVGYDCPLDETNYGGEFFPSYHSLGYCECTQGGQ